MVSEKPLLPATTIRVLRSSDGFFFNRTTRLFTPTAVSTMTAVDYTYTLNSITNTTLTSAGFYDLPQTATDLIFEYTTATTIPTVTYERHMFGQPYTNSTAATCKLFGYLKTVDGRPLYNARIDVHVLRDSYLKDYMSSVGNAFYALSDETGYFELDLVQGINVLITVPMLGMNVQGRVPASPTLELSTTCLLGG